MILWAASSDRRHERRWHFVTACLLAAAGLAAAGLVAAGMTNDLVWAIAATSIAAIGLYGSKPVFWPMPSTFLSGTAAAGVIALVNSIGNLGGFVGPYIVGWIRDATQSYEAGLYFLAACALASAAIAFSRCDRRRSRFRHRRTSKRCSAQRTSVGLESSDMKIKACSCCV